MCSRVALELEIEALRQRTVEQMLLIGLAAKPFEIIGVSSPRANARTHDRPVATGSAELDPVSIDTPVLDAMPVIQVARRPRYRADRGSCGSPGTAGRAGRAAGVGQQDDVRSKVEAIDQSEVVDETEAQPLADLCHHVQSANSSRIVVGKNDQLRRNPGHPPLLRCAPPFIRCKRDQLQFGYGGRCGGRHDIVPLERHGFRQKDDIAARPD